MLAYTLRRIAQLVPVVLVLTVAVFGFVEALPGSIVDTLIGTEGGDDEETREVLTKEYGLDRPVHERYALWLGRVVQFDFGHSLVTRRPISTELLSRIPATVYLAVVGITLSMLIAVPLGTLAAVRRNTAVDYTAQVTSLAGISIPEFWFAILCVLLFSLHLGWLPSSGYVSPFEDFWGNMKAMIMPAFVLGNAIAAVLMRHTRSAMLQVLSSDYVRTARAKGLPEREVVLKHALRNALIPVITLGTLELGTLLSGAVLTEQIFSIPGFGKLIVDAVFNRDYAVVQGVVLVTATTYITLNLIADILYVMVNPRLRN
jgi:peptide/nickel transport system permease protein